MCLAAIRDKIAIEQGCQIYPHSKIKVGAVLYKVDVSEWDDGSTSISIDEWVVRSIKRRRGTQTPMGKKRVGDAYGDTAPLYVNVTAKIKNTTWVRQSKHDNNFGWSNSIPKHSWPSGLHDYYITVGSQSTLPISVDGFEIGPGESKLLSVDFGNGDEQIIIPVSARGGEIGTSNIMVEIPQLKSKYN
ncbi:hypothetical protein AB4562_07090 [Vibrio sp. 10N.222.54.A1]|uniref:hypothetical protein n=1 Tax=unclassified Vibrio TaxID=2614977 RepID=UPI00354FBBCD